MRTLLDVADGLNVRYFRIETIDDLKFAITEILDEIHKKGLKPWLHLDAHGLDDESGFVFAMKENKCSWVDFKKIITPLNVALGLNLIVVFATCFGGSFTRVIDTTDRAPVLGLIGPTREVKVGEVERNFPAFYKTFFNTLSLADALKALDADAPEGLYYRTTAEQFFYTVWTTYKKSYCTKEEIENRARRLHKKAKKEKLPRILSVGKIKRDLTSKDFERKVFEKFRDIYFMYDIEQLNKERFPVTYMEAEAQVKNKR